MAKSAEQKAADKAAREAAKAEQVKIGKESEAQAPKEAAPESEPDITPATDEPKVIRKIDCVILHCSDSDNPKHDNPETIKQWHTERGFPGGDGVLGTDDDIGYHYVITKNGKLHHGRPLEQVGAHCKGHNATSIGICLTGQKDFKREQFRTLRKTIDFLMKEYGLTWKQIKLHNQFDKNKTCPNFPMREVVSG